MTRRIFQYLSSATILLLMAVPGSAAEAVRGPLGVDVGISGNGAIGGAPQDDTAITEPRSAGRSALANTEES